MLNWLLICRRHLLCRARPHSGMRTSFAPWEECVSCCDQTHCLGLWVKVLHSEETGLGKKVSALALNMGFEWGRIHREELEVCSVNVSCTSSREVQFHNSRCSHATMHAVWYSIHCNFVSRQQILDEAG